MKMNSRQVLTVFLGMILLTSIVPNSFALSYDLDSQINLSSNSGESYESKLLASGTDVFVVWRDLTGGNSDILFKKSSDSGATFGSTLPRLDNGTASVSPQISASGTNIYAVWQENTTPNVIAFAKSSDTGGSFGAQVILSSLTSSSSVPQIASSSSDVYVTWNQANQIIFSDSADSGGTFDAPIKLSNGTASEPKLAISGTNVYTVWTEDDDISFIKSTSGDTFDTRKNLSNSIATSANPEIASSGSNVYVVWKEGTDIFFANSTDSGATFSTPVDLGDTGGASSPNPEISVDGTNVYVVWSQLVSGKGDVSFVKSSDSGTSFGAVVNLSNNSGDSLLPKIASSGGKVSVTWEDQTPGNREIFLRSSDTSGTSFGSAANISNNAGFSLEPEITMVGSRPYVIWEDTTTPPAVGSVRDILFVTGTESAISISFDQTEYTLNNSAQITVTDLGSSGSGPIDVTVTSTSDGTGFIASLTETGTPGEFQGIITFDDTTAGSAIEAKAGDTITASYGIKSITALISPITIEVQYSGSPFTTFGYGDIVNVQVEDKNSNTDSGIIETITVTITSIRDNVGTSLTLTETGPNTGIFGGSSSTLIFTNGDAAVTTAGSVTLSQEDPSSDIDPNNPDTMTGVISIRSTTDPAGISVTLTETGKSSKTFSKRINLNPNASVPDTKLKVSAGDIIRVTNGFRTTNGLVIPNTNAAKGAISVDFTTPDTVTVSYRGESTSITVNNAADGGGGGGGLVSPGLVVNALAGLGGGGGSPTSTLNNLLSSRVIDVPEKVKQMVFDHDAYSPLLPMDPDSFDGFDLPLVINDKGFVLGGFTSTLQTQTLKTDTPVTLKFTVYTDDKVQHFSLYTNLRDTNDSIAKSDTQILYNDGKDLKIIDPQGFFSDAKITVTEEGPVKRHILVEITFAKEMETSHIITRMWDSHLRSGDTHILDAIRVEPVEPEFNPIPQLGEEVETQELKSQVIPKWVKNNAGWWTENQIDDESFVTGIQYLINNGIMYIPNTESVNSSVTEIPDWIKNNAEWWAHDQISDDDFVKAMEWLVSNGVIVIG